MEQLKDSLTPEISEVRERVEQEMKERLACLRDGMNVEESQQDVDEPLNVSEGSAPPKARSSRKTKDKSHPLPNAGCPTRTSKRLAVNPDSSKENSQVKRPLPTDTELSGSQKRRKIQQPSSSDATSTKTSTGTKRGKRPEHVTLVDGRKGLILREK